MKLGKIEALLLAGGLFAGLQAHAAEKMDFGKREYESNCASCHGARGKGDGPYKPFLNKSPSDLTVLSKSNGGVFPFERTYAIIDGRQVVKAHGPMDMPVWGAEYNARASADYTEVPYYSEVYIRTRILALTEYLYRLQGR
jgi:mono/diheme cytochrome c family protein